MQIAYNMSRLGRESHIPCDRCGSPDGQTVSMVSARLIKGRWLLTNSLIGHRTCIELTRVGEYVRSEQIFLGSRDIADPREYDVHELPLDQKRDELFIGSLGPASLRAQDNGVSEISPSDDDIGKELVAAGWFWYVPTTGTIHRTQEAAVATRKDVQQRRLLCR